MTETRPVEWCTPFVVGSMPEGLPMQPDDNLNRANFHHTVESSVMDLIKVRGSRPIEGVLTREVSTGELFYLTHNVDCGLGCRCAAEIRWAPEWEQLVDKPGPRERS